MSAHLDRGRRYRLGSADRSGWLLGLGPIPCVILAAGLLIGGVTLNATGSILLAALPVAGAALAAFGRRDGRAAHEWVEPLVGWMSLRAAHRERWSARVPFAGGEHSPADVPPFLEGLALTERPSRWTRLPRPTGVAVVADDRSQRVTGAFRVRGREFALLEHDEQSRVLDGWGSALAGFCRERSPVTRIAWSEWAAPASLEDHLAFVREQHDGTAAGSRLRDYLELVARAGPLTIEHEVVVTVSVDRRRIQRSHTTGDAAVDVLLEEIHHFATRLEEAGLVVDPPLAPAELGGVLRLRADPSAASRLAIRAQRLGAQVGSVAPQNATPLAVDVAWRHVRVDQAWHRSYWIAEWPRLEVPGDWLAGLLLHAGGIRTITVVYEPVAPSRSRRAVDREATRLVSDEEERSARGFRIRAQHRRAEAEVLARETELVAGYSELRYAGFLTVTAADRQSLDDQAAEWEQVSAQCGLELRALDGQHDLGLCAGLPLGRVPTGRGRR